MPEMWCTICGVWHKPTECCPRDCEELSDSAFMSQMTFADLKAAAIKMKEKPTIDQVFDDAKSIARQRNWSEMYQ